MRKAFVEAITPILKNNEDHVFITGDLGFGAFEELQEMLGKRFINAGVAEQNMVSVAAGMAKQGYRPWVYSITPFATLRCLEQIRNDVCFPKLPVTIVGNGAGFTYGMNGPSHFGLDDIGVMKNLPHIDLMFPVDEDQLREIIDRICQDPYDDRASYIRLGISPYETKRKKVGPSDYLFVNPYKYGKKCTVICFGQATQIALRAIDMDFSAMDCDVFGVGSYPFCLDAFGEAIVTSVMQTGRIIFVDEHNSRTSLGHDFLSEFILNDYHIVEGMPPFDVHFLGNGNMDIDRIFGESNGDSLWHHKRCGLTPEALISLVKEMTTQ